jgi:hypothetical protein
MKSFRPENDKKEDYLVKVNLKFSDTEIKSIPCRIFLPETILEKPYFLFKPSKQQFDKLSYVNTASFSTQLNGHTGKPEVTLTSSEIYLSNKIGRSWGPDIFDASIKGEPQDLEVEQLINQHRKDDIGDVDITFWISPNAFLEPQMKTIPSFLGDVKTKRSKHSQVKIDDDLTIIFDNHFKSKRKNKKNLLMSSYLVGCCKSGDKFLSETGYQEKILSVLDKFLSLVSLGSRTRTCFLGWEAVTSSSIAKYYRCGFSFPSGKSEFLINCAFPDDFTDSNHTEGLLESNDFDDFLSTCFPALLSYPNPDVLHQAIVSVVPGHKRTLEESFLSMFAGIEALLLDYRKRKNLQFVIADPDEWKEFKKELKKSIKTLLKDCHPKQRCAVYEKLDELNRISLRRVFEQFCDEYKVAFRDLWPLFQSGDFVGLTDIRNKIIHGDRIPSEYISTLSKAKSSLQYIVERMILSLLRFPVTKSTIDPYGLSIKPYELNWTDDELQKFKSYIEMM